MFLAFIHHSVFSNSKSVTSEDRVTCGSVTSIYLVNFLSG